MKKGSIAMAFLVLLLAGAALIMPAQAAAEIQNLDIFPDPASPGQNVSVTFQGRVTTAWQVFYYAIAFSNDASIEYVDDWVVEEDGIYNSSMPAISHDVNPGMPGFQDDADPGTWYDYDLTIRVPADYGGAYYVNVITGENYVQCQQYTNWWQDSPSLAFTVSEAEPEPPVPDVSSLILFASGLVLISVYFVYGRRRKEGG